MGIRKKVTFIICLLCISLTTTVCIIAGLITTSDKKTDIGSSLAETAFLTSEKLDRYMWSRYSEIKTFSQVDSLVSADNQQTTRDVLNNLQSNIPAFSWIGLTDKKGKVVVSTGSILEGVDISMRPVFTEGIKGEFLGDVHDAVLLSKLLPNPTGEPMKFVDVSFAISDIKGEKKGVLAAHLSWEWVREVQRRVIALEKHKRNLQVYIVSLNGNTVLLGPEKSIGKTLNIETVDTARTKKNGWAVERLPDGKEYLIGYSFSNGYYEYKGFGWTVLTIQPLQEAYKPVVMNILFIAITGVVFTLLFSIGGWYFAGTITEPLVFAAEAADKLRFGDVAPIPVYKGVKEAEALCRSINELIFSLSDAEKRLDKMQYAAHTDRLTGLPNRAALDEYIVKTTALAARNEKPLEFLYIDLDGFKPINDKYGHAAGDLVLIEVGKRLNECIRKEEIVARIGGDEFVAIIYSDESNAGESVAQRILNALTSPFDIGTMEVSAGCSIGISRWNKDLSVKAVLENADKALYMSKKSGKNRFTRL